MEYKSDNDIQLIAQISKNNCYQKSIPFKTEPFYYNNNNNNNQITKLIYQSENNQDLFDRINELELEKKQLLETIHLQSNKIKELKINNKVKTNYLNKIIKLKSKHESNLHKVIDNLQLRIKPNKENNSNTVNITLNDVIISKYNTNETNMPKVRKIHET